MTGFRFIFPDDDDEGFELVEDATETIEDEQDREELAQPENDVIWETEED